MLEDQSPARKYYRVASGPCWDACVAWRTVKNEVWDSCKAYATSVGGIGFYQGSTANVINGTALSAVIFDCPPPDGWKARRWRSLKGLKHGQTAAWPDKRTAVGKANLAKINALKMAPPSDDVCRAIGFPTSIQYDGERGRGSAVLGFWETARIGWSGDTFYIALPDLEAVRRGYIDRGYTVTTPAWAPLDGMEPIIKEEMDLDFARAKLAKMDEAA